jgi:hypothetical protein
MSDRKVTAALLILSLALLVYGASAGELTAIRSKAAHLCLECIGLG